MNALDLISTAIGNAFRAKTRTILTVIAIFIGAFTLTLTNGLGTGINRYIADTVASIGASDVMTLTKTAETSDTGDGPSEYDPDTLTTGAGPGGAGGAGAPGATTVEAITADDLDAIAVVEGVVKVEPVRTLSVDYIQHDDGTRYTITAGSLIPGQSIQLTAGTDPDDDSAAFELALPGEYVDALGLGSADDAVGAAVQIGLTDAAGDTHTVEATVSGITEATFALGGTGGLIPNATLADELADLGNLGVPEAQQDRYTQASVWFDADATEEQITALKERLADAGYTATTVTDQLGAFTAVIDGIVLVLNAFAVIALLAASFGIVNTLLMSVQERTREIGLMKAMGMASGRVFALFSLEATFIGFLGSAIGIGIAMLVGSAVSGALSGSLLADLPGLRLIAFDPVSIVVTILVVMAVAFLAGTLPAARAARKDPVDALRYE